MDSGKDGEEWRKLQGKVADELAGEYNDTMDEDWISVTDAVRLSGYHPDHLRELIREAKIKARKIVTVWQVSRTSLLTYISEAKKSSDKRRGPKK
jgi:hypothetical protein